MSYVLNALRRADAERERGAVPDLHSQASTALDAQTPTQDRLRWPIWVLGAVAIATLAVFAALLWNRNTPAPMASAPASVPSPLPAPAPKATAAPAPPPQVLIRIESPPTAPAPAPLAARPASPAPTAPTAPTATDVQRLQDLPESLRRQLPAMAFGGAMDSPVASGRMLIINGQVFREGESPAAGLTLERIQLRSAILNFKGQRFEVGY